MEPIIDLNVYPKPVLARDIHKIIRRNISNILFFFSNSDMKSLMIKSKVESLSKRFPKVFCYKVGWVGYKNYGRSLDPSDIYEVSIWRLKKKVKSFIDPTFQELNFLFEYAHNRLIGEDSSIYYSILQDEINTFRLKIKRKNYRMKRELQVMSTKISPIIQVLDKIPIKYSSNSNKKSDNVSNKQPNHNDNSLIGEVNLNSQPVTFRKYAPLFDNKIINKSLNPVNSTFIESKNATENELKTAVSLIDLKYGLNQNESVNKPSIINDKNLFFQSEFEPIRNIMIHRENLNPYPFPLIINSQRQSLPSSENSKPLLYAHNLNSYVNGLNKHDECKINTKISTWKFWEDISQRRKNSNMNIYNSINDKKN